VSPLRSCVMISRQRTPSSSQLLKRYSIVPRWPHLQPTFWVLFLARVTFLHPLYSPRLTRTFMALAGCGVRCRSFHSLPHTELHPAPGRNQPLMSDWPSLAQCACKPADYRASFDMAFQYVSIRGPRAPGMWKACGP